MIPARKRGRPSLAPRLGRAGTKWCNRGQHFVLVTEFRLRSDGYYAAYCRDCEKRYDRDRKRSKQSGRKGQED